MDNDIKYILSDLGLITQVGLTVIVCLIIGLIIGIMADKWMNHEWIFKTIGIIMGLSAGLYQAYRVLLKKIQ